MFNLFHPLPADMTEERFENLLATPHVRIERIVSQGHTSPAQGWYDQDEDEWVLVLTGSGTLEFEDGRRQMLAPGDHLYIPAHQKHRVCYTAPDEPTIWLAVFVPAAGRERHADIKSPEPG
ncbi:cupin domain-containing protein [Oceanimonas sp. CHS3-5]|uniref:cupin domain-containing protein n=1 Tax=Oceanimonas sp. CHS3-5 TaxID=3068186 RepID=UPI00273FCFF1|nr:cupin domain-containing protein [Oceanimonas sp. CHS3-5]MDP5291263.1 cupin domain-containing protein [Oceanimonas sp. CHS3-5]